MTLEPPVLVADSQWTSPLATYTAWDLEPFARDCGYDAPPFRWDEQRRSLLRAELDAAFFHLYGIHRDDAAYILDTFPIVRRKDIEKYGEYRTKSLILEIYDQLAAATHTGQPYQTRLQTSDLDRSGIWPARRRAVRDHRSPSNPLRSRHRGTSRT
jgi:hypothetical protein